MKSKLFLIIALLISTFTCLAQKNNELVGTWKMVSGMMIKNDSTFPTDINKIEAMKIVTPNHFAVFSKDKSTGLVQNAGAGNLIVSGNQYTEVLIYRVGMATLEPVKAIFTYKLEGNKWHIKGGFDPYLFDETWERVK